MSLTKQQVIANIHAVHDDWAKTEIEALLDTYAVVICEQINDGRDVPLPRLGKLKLGTRAARTGRNPQTGEPVDIPASTTIRFAPSKAVKDLLPKP